MKGPGESPENHTPQQHVLLRSRSVLILVCLTSGLLIGTLTTFPSSEQQEQLPYKLVKGSNTAEADEQEPEQELSSTWQVPGVRECRVEGDSSICPWCNATFTKQHPLSPQHFQRAYLPGKPCSMPSAVLQKLQSGEPLHITVLGGSMTHGTACDDGVRAGPACAWPSRLQQRLVQAYPAANINVSNKARPGSHYGAWLEAGDLELLIEGADLVIIDLQVNSQIYKFDAFTQMEDTDEFIHRLRMAAFTQQRHVGFLFVESFRTCATTHGDCNGHCPEHRQGRLAYNMSSHSSEIRWCNRWWTMASMERPIAHHHGLPIASYRDAVWPVISQPDPLLPCFWNGLSHMDALGHMLFADVIAYAFARSVQDTDRDQQQQLCGERETSEPTKFHQLAKGRRYCAPGSRPGSYMVARQPGSFNPVAHSGCWSFYEDRPGKPGWICQPGFSSSKSSNSGKSGNPVGTTAQQQSTAVPAAGTGHINKGQLDVLLHHHGYSNLTSNTIWFAVTFSNTPQLQISYLTTYQDIGSAEVSLFLVGSAPTARSGGDGDAAAAGNGNGSSTAAAATTAPAPTPAGSGAAAAAAVGSNNGSMAVTGQSLTRLAAYTLNPLVTQKYSVPRTTFWVHSSVADHWKGHAQVHQLPGGVQGGEYLVSVQPVMQAALSTKFKLLAVMSC